MPEAFGGQACCSRAPTWPCRSAATSRRALLLPRDHPLRARLRAARRLERRLRRALDRRRAAERRQPPLALDPGAGASTWSRRWSATGRRASARRTPTDYDGRGQPLRRALPVIHHHRARRVDRRHRRHRGQRRADDARSCSRSRSRSSSRRRSGGCTSARWPRTRGGTIAESEDPGRLARDAYTYLHLPIVAGIILSRRRRRAADRAPRRLTGHRGGRDGARRPGPLPSRREPASGCG